MMVDVGGKADSVRRAAASCRVVLRAETLALIYGKQAPKGDVLAAARIAGIMAAKRTADLIPLCHPLRLDAVAVAFEPVTDDGLSAIAIRATVSANGPTGVEMEALTAAAVASLTIYDMCKAVDRGMRVEGLRVVEKSGGRSGDFKQD